MDEGYLILGIVIGVVIMGIANIFCTPPITLSQDTGDYICYNLTQQKGVVASSVDGKLICETPSFDSTQQIVVRHNNEKGG